MCLLTIVCVGLFFADQTAAGSVYDVIGGKCCIEDACYPTSADITSLKNKMTGSLEQQSSSTYKADSLMYNTNQYRKVNLIAMVENLNDIKHVVLFAQQFNLHVTTRSSGHDFVGRSTWTGSLSINLSRMKDIQVDVSSVRHPDGEVKVQTGITWEEIYVELDKHNRTVVGGSAHTVTPGGYTLGGGHSPISRTHGYAVDNLLEIQAVLADGRIATCTQNNTIIEEVNGTVHTVDDGDLFWAMSGGGGGTFGVVVYFIYKLHPQPAQMVQVTGLIPLKYTAPFYSDISDETFNVLKNLINSLPPQWGGYWLLNNGYQWFYKRDIPRLPYDIQIKGSLFLSLNKFAPWDEATDKPLFEELVSYGKKYSLDIVFSNKTSFWDYEKNAYDPLSSRSYLVATLLQQQGMNEDLIQFFKKEFFGNFNDDYLGCTGIMLGGRTNEIAVGATPLHPGYRNAISCLTCYVALGDPERPGPVEKEQCLINKADQLNLRLRPLGDGMYFNEPTQNNPYWKEDFWGTDNYNRLLQIKLRYDPDNFFTCQHCVGSDLAPNKGNYTNCSAARIPNIPCTVSSGPTSAPCHLMLALVALLAMLIL